MDEFSSLTDNDMTLYAVQMEQIKARIDAAAAFFAQPKTYPSVEAGILQLRLALETLVLSSLVSNRKAVEAVSTAFAKKDHAAAFKLARDVNPSFWPLPSEQQFDAGIGMMKMVPITTGYLTEGEYLPTWGRLSAWLHATNPFKAMPEPEDGSALGLSVVDKLIVLLDHHSVSLPERNELLVCMMNEAETGRVHVFGFGSVNS